MGLTNFSPDNLRAEINPEGGFATNEKYDKTTSLQLSYNILKRFGRAVPCVKRYLGDRVTSETVRIDADEWEIAIFLPVERFQKASKATVWRDSRRFF